MNISGTQSSACQLALPIMGINLVKSILDLLLRIMLRVKLASWGVRAFFILDNPQNFFECGCPGWNSGILGSHDRLATSIISSIAYYYQKLWNESPYLSI